MILNRQQMVCLLLAMAQISSAVAFEGAFTSENEGAIAVAAATLEATLREKFPSAKRIQTTPLVDVGDGRRALISRANSDNIKSTVRRIGARSAVALVATEDHRNIRTVVWFDAKVLDDVMTATRDLASLTSLADSDVRVAEQNILQNGCTPLIANNSVSEMRLRRRLRAGEVVCREYLEHRPAIARGESVNVRYMSDRVELSTKCIARHDANVGQRVALVNPVTKEVFTGEVAGEGEVRVYAR